MRVFLENFVKSFCPHKMLVPCVPAVLLADTTFNVSTKGLYWDNIRRSQNCHCLWSGHSWSCYGLPLELIFASVGDPGSLQFQKSKENWKFAHHALNMYVSIHNPAKVSSHQIFWPSSDAVAVWMLFVSGKAVGLIFNLASVWVKGLNVSRSLTCKQNIYIFNHRGKNWI